MPTPSSDPREQTMPCRVHIEVGPVEPAQLTAWRWLWRRLLDPRDPEIPPRSTS